MLVKWVSLDTAQAEVGAASSLHPQEAELLYDLLAPSCSRVA